MLTTHFRDIYIFIYIYNYIYIIFIYIYIYIYGLTSQMKIATYVENKESSSSLDLGRTTFFPSPNSESSSRT